jgi:hypothetical protein
MNTKTLILASLLFISGSNVFAMHLDHNPVEKIILYALDDKPATRLATFSHVSKTWENVVAEIKKFIFINKPLLETKLKSVLWEALYIVIKWQDLQLAPEEFENLLRGKKNLQLHSKVNNI